MNQDQPQRGPATAEELRKVRDGDWVCPRCGEPLEWGDVGHVEDSEYQWVIHENATTDCDFEFREWSEPIKWADEEHEAVILRDGPVLALVRAADRVLTDYPHQSEYSMRELAKALEPYRDQL